MADSVAAVYLIIFLPLPLVLELGLLDYLPVCDDLLFEALPIALTAFPHFGYVLLHHHYPQPPFDLTHHILVVKLAVSLKVDARNQWLALQNGQLCAAFGLLTEPSRRVSIDSRELKLFGGIEVLLVGEGYLLGEVF